MEQERIVSATLAEIYLNQGYFDHAIEMYGRLAKSEPENSYYRKRLANIKRDQREKKKSGGFKGLLKKKLW